MHLMADTDSALKVILLAACAADAGTGQQGPRPGQTPGSMPMVPSADGKASAAMTPVQNQTLQSPPR